MKRPSNVLLFLALALGPLPAFAQTGALDQVSPFPPGGASASYNYDAPSLVWQQQVRAGLGGQLEGFELTLGGAVGSTFGVRLRLGDGWTLSPVVWSGTSAPASGAFGETQFFDVTAAGIALSAGDTFVIEIQGNGSGASGFGSYIAPPAAPLYAENLYLGGPGCFADCGWRLAFRTWMLGGIGTSYCAGSASLVCPCGNQGGAGEGCANSTGAGAVLSASGGLTVVPDVLQFACSGLIPGQPVLLFSANNQVNGGLGALFGDGLRCAGGSVQRLGVRVPNAAGEASWGPGLATAGGWAPGDTRRFQTWYRDPAGPCGSGFNLSNGLELTFF